MELATQRPAHAVAARGRKHGSGYALVVSPPILLAPFAATVTITVDGVICVRCLKGRPPGHEDLPAVPQHALASTERCLPPRCPACALPRQWHAPCPLPTYHPYRTQVRTAVRVPLLRRLSTAVADAGAPAAKPAVKPDCAQLPVLVGPLQEAARL